MLPIALAFIVFATGIGMLLSALYVRFRDVQPIWEVTVQAWFYCSPIMYIAVSNKNRFGPGFAHVAMLNPVAVLLTQMGHAFIGAAGLPGGGQRLRRFVTVIIAIAIIPAMFALGWWFFTREAPRVAENL